MDGSHPKCILYLIVHKQSGPKRLDYTQKEVLLACKYKKNISYVNSLKAKQKDRVSNIGKRKMKVRF